MKLNVELLRSLQSSEDVIEKYINTPELHDIDLNEITEITVGDEDLFDCVCWLKNKLKSKFPAKIITLKKSDNELTRMYDENGNIRKEKHTYNGGKWKEYHYDTNGNVLKYITSNNYWEEKTYDKQGNLLTINNSDGYWKLYYYNNNKIVHVKDSKGYWMRYYYNKYHKLTTIRDSKGYWERHYYNKNNQLEAVKKSTGEWERWFYDKNGKLLKYTKSNGYSINYIKKTKFDMSVFEIVSQTPKN